MIYALLLLLTAFIWGTAFVAQAIGADAMSALSFLAVRTWIAVAALLPVVLFRKRRLGVLVGMTGKVPTGKTLLLGGLVCGSFLFLGSAFQQAGIPLTTTAKAGFITTLYVVLVPLFSYFFGSRPSAKVWLCALLALFGLYLLSMRGSFTFAFGDLLILFCALAFTFQIISVGFFVQKIDPILLALLQFVFTALFASCGSLLFESFSYADVMAALPSLLYTGVLSSAVAFTIEVYVQQKIAPSIAALLMSMESVFSALAGWVILGQTLSARELAGCAVMFCAIVLSQIPFPNQKQKAE